MRFLSKRMLIVGVLCALTLPGSALSGEEGGLSTKFLEGLRSSVKMDAAARAAQNALTSNNPQTLVLNRSVVQGHEAVFSHKIKTKGITNQRASGRCWLFAGLNVVRPLVIEKHKLAEFEFSESYLSFWDKLEKANCFLEDMIALSSRAPFDRELDFLLKEPMCDGGYWDCFVALVEKYGLAPKSAMPESFAAENTAVMNLVLERKLRIDAAKLRAMAAAKKPKKELRQAKEKMLADFYRVLVLHYGQPPVEFTFRRVDKDGKAGPPKTYTPKSFYREWVGSGLDQYANLCNDPTHPYGKHYRLRRIRNVVGTPEVHYVNVPIDALKKMAVKSVLADEPVWFGADVTHDMDRASGIMQVDLFDYGSMYGMDLKQSKADRLLLRGAVANHAMTFIGVDMRGKKPVKWLVENSWGKERGDGGLWTMYDQWFDEHVYGVVVRKAYVPNDVLATFKEEPVELPPWAPMYSVFR